MYPDIHLGPLTLQTFGIMFALGFIAAGALVARRLRELGKPADWAYEMMLRGAVRRRDRLADLLHRRELRPGQERPPRQPLLRLGAGLVRGRDRRRDRRPALGPVPGLPRPGAARRLRPLAGDRLRDRADRLPALRRRRLRQGLGRPLGDGLPGWQRADRRTPSTRRPVYETVAMACSPTCSGGCATASSAGILFAIYLDASRAPSASWSSSSAATTTSSSASPRLSSMSLAMIVAGIVWVLVVAPPRHPRPPGARAAARRHR